MKKILIIGFGDMGSIFAREFSNLENFDVSVYMRDKQKRKENKGKFNYKFLDSLEESVPKYDIIVLAVTTSSLESVINQIKKHVRKDALVIDVSSIKQKPMKLMEKLKCESIGTHPLFGYVDNFKGYKIVLCPRNKNQENGKNFQMIKKALSDTGAEILVLSAEEHDKLLGKIQGITHFIGLNLEDFFEKNNEEKLRKLATPTFQYLLGLVDRMRENKKHVFIIIQKENKYAKKTREEFMKQLKKFCEEMEK